MAQACTPRKASAAYPCKFEGNLGCLARSSLQASKKTPNQPKEASFSQTTNGLAWSQGCMLLCWLRTLCSLHASPGPWGPFCSRSDEATVSVRDTERLLLESSQQIHLDALVLVHDRLVSVTFLLRTVQSGHEPLPPIAIPSPTVAFQVTLLDSCYDSNSGWRKNSPVERIQYFWIRMQAKTVPGR